MTARVLLALVTGAFLLGACSNLTGTSAQQMREWSDAASYPSLSAQINADRTGVENGIRLSNLKALRTACAGFAQDAASLEGELPAPDRSISADLATALTDYYKAGTDCFASSSFTDAFYVKFQRELRSGDRANAQATSKLRRDGVR